MEATGVEDALLTTAVMEELPMKVEVEMETKKNNTPGEEEENEEVGTKKTLAKEEEENEEAARNKGDNANNDTTLTVPIVKIPKGKRTKRQRVYPPVLNSFVAPAASSNFSNGDEDVDDGGGDDHDDADYNYNGEDDDEEEDGVIMARPLPVLPPPVVLTVLLDGSTEEEEDMANCLILLAQGSSSFVTNNHVNAAISSAVNNNNIASGKFTSRKFMETGSGVEGGGKVGYYVYECRTCNRTFPSFQALGGHRASHKKPKNLLVTNNTFLAMAPSYNEETNFLQLNSGGGLTASNHKGNNSNYNRVHECGQCGAEFNSGQALGGHMRRHRAPPTTIATNLSLLTSNNGGLSSYKNTAANNNKVRGTSGEERLVLGKRGRSLRTTSLDLDLNQLPAPEEKQPITNLPPANNKPTTVFPSQALVGCHY